MYPYTQQPFNAYRQQPIVQYLPPVVIERYLNQWVTTTIPGYGRVVAYVADYNPRTGMVSLLIYPPPTYRQQFIQVHHSDLVGISPYFGPTPPRPQPPGPPGPPRPPWPPRPRPPWWWFPWFPWGQSGQWGGGGFGGTMED